jgi:hypothetical protein
MPAATSSKSFDLKAAFADAAVNGFRDTTVR